MLRLLNIDGLETLALHRENKRLEEAGQPEEWTEMKPGFPPYAVYDGDAGLFVICGEGVGWEVNDDNHLSIPFYGRWKDHEEGTTHFSMTPSTELEFSPNDVRNMASGNEIDLADLVREFGDRLETNFGIWYRKFNDGAVPFEHTK
jgi:hypothetical protein